MPAGLKTFKRHEVARYKRFSYCYPPYQFQDKHLIKHPGGELKPLGSESREVLMCYGKDYTHAAFSATDRRRDPLGWERARCSVLGNTFHAGVVAYLISFLFHEWGLIDAPLSIDYVADPGAPADADGDESEGSVWNGNYDEKAAFTLVRY